MEPLDMIFKILYFVFCVFQILWIIYDIINFIVKRLTYNIVDAEVWQHKPNPVCTAGEPRTYHIQLKYFYNNKEYYFLSKLGANVFLPKIGAKRKIYINKNDSSKIYYFELKLFIFYTLFRLAFTIPLIEAIVKGI